MPASTESFWRNLGFAVVQGYGMTEPAALVSVAHPFKPERGSIGKAAAWNGNEGCHQRRDPGSRRQHLARHLERGVKPLADAEGWLHTGDLARTEESGHLYFQGRQKDVIVTAAGVNIHPEDLEAAINRQEGVRSERRYRRGGPPGT